MITRRQLMVVATLATATLAPVSSARAAPREKRVLFVCTGNYYRSRFAQAVFNNHPAPGWTAFSRGLAASARTPPVSPLVIAELSRRHIDASRVAGDPTQLTRADLDSADLVVLLDGSEHLAMLKKQFPDYPRDKVRTWSVADAPGLAPDAAFAVMWSATQSLVAELLGK